MNTTLKASIGFGAVLVLLVLVLLMSRVSPVLGSVADGNTYSHATTTTNVSKVVKTTFNASPVCTLGSIVIASSSATSFVIKNATSTTDVSSSTIASFEANAAENTYTFDISCSRGIVVDAPAGFNGYVITTYR
jgi:uncharacterized protein (UPF0333 family)